jgi:hypothetical protein
MRDMLKNGLKTTDATTKVTKGFTLSDQDPIVKELVLQSTLNGFLVIGQQGKILYFCGAEGATAISIPVEEGFNVVPGSIAALLQDPNVVKIECGVDDVTTIEKCCRPSVYINGVVKLTDCVSKVLNLQVNDRFFRQHLDDKVFEVDTSKKPFANPRFISDEAWMSIIQTGRAGVWTLWQVVEALSTCKLLEDHENLMPYTRQIFSQFITLKGTSNTNASIFDVALWLKKDRYFTPISELATPPDFFDKLNSTHLLPLLLKTRNASFYNPNKVGPFSSGCRKCGNRQEEHECPLADQEGCVYPPCQGKDHLVYTCNRLVNFCCLCEHRGHEEEDHLQFDQVTLDSFFLLYSKFNLKTGYVYLAQTPSYFPKVSQIHWRFGLYSSRPSEVPKYPLIVEIPPPKVKEAGVVREKVDTKKGLKGLHEDVSCLRQRPLAGIDQQEDAIHHH